MQFRVLRRHAGLVMLTRRKVSAAGDAARLDGMARTWSELDIEVV
jgi:hypothetical protein